MIPTNKNNIYDHPYQESTFFMNPDTLEVIDGLMPTPKNIKKNEQEFFEIDELAVPVIRSCISKGFETLYCCSGHIISNIEPYIMFKGTHNFEDMPKGWSIDEEFNDGRTVIRYKSKNHTNNKNTSNDQYFKRCEELLSAIKNICEYFDEYSNVKKETNADNLINERFKPKYPSRFNMYQELKEESDDIDEKEEDEENDDDLDNFGVDDSDEQNEYDSKDIEILNHLIASESDAINDYFDGAKDCSDETLRRLYGDIGHEERFHLEQLLYAKSTLTGEKYEPRDSKVKKEYEELLAMGMDEDNAVHTAIDKQSMIKEDDGDDSDIEELQKDTEVIEMACYHNEILFNYCEQAMYSEMDEAISTFIEAYIYQEEMDNVSSAPKNIKYLPSPAKIIHKGFKTIINTLIRLSHIIRDTISSMNIKMRRKTDWIKNHGIKDLFASGISLYFYSDNNSMIDLDEPVRYVDLLYRLTKTIGENCGFRLNNNAQHKTISKPIKFKTIKEGLNILNGTIMTKTKVVVNGNNQKILEREFFGYSDTKIPVKTYYDNSDKGINNSDNIYNRFETLILTTKKYAEVSKEILDALEKAQGDLDGVYYKNRKLYNESYSAMEKIVGFYNKIVSALSHDMNVILKLNTGLLEMTRQRDKVEQNGGEWTGADIRTDNSMSKPTNSPVYVKKKKPKLFPHK